MSSRHNRRMSMGGGALRESSRHNRSRRMSMGGGALRSETPKKDRHAMLEEYRKRSRENNDSFDSGQYPRANHSSKQHGGAPPVAPPLPSSSRAPPAPQQQQLEGTTALERFRLRKQQKLQQHWDRSGGEDYSFNNSSNGGGSSFYAEDDDSTVNFGISSNSTLALTMGNAVPPGISNSSQYYSSNPPPRNPSNRSFQRQHSLSQESPGGGGAFLAPSLSQESESGGAAGSQLSQESCGSVENMARYEEMVKRLRKLEEEKVGITIAMAPIEARHRQKEDAWMKEQSRLLQEIDSLKQASQEANERFRDLEAQYEAKEEENRNLRMRVLKESSTTYQSSNAIVGGGNSVWSRHLQVDRDVVELKEKLQTAEEEIRATRLAKVSVEKELHATKIECNSILRAYEELQEEYDEISKSTSDNREANIQLEVLTTEHIATSAQLNAVCSDLAASKAAFEATTEEMERNHAEELEKYQFEMSVLKTRAASSVQMDQSVHDSNVEDYAVLKARIEERDRKIAEFDKERLAWEAMRRQMHNRIQELRGNIRVFVRTRPFLPNDGNETSSAIDVSPDGESLDIFDARTNAPHGFKFDKVFPPSAGQDLVFQEVADFVQSALDGFHVCLFSYGQTGSGKTHTMQGSGNGAMRGIIPRAVEQILSQATAMQQAGWTFNLSASFLEIYNEDLKDLLVDMAPGGGPPSRNPQKLAIKRSREGKSYVDGLTEVPIETVDSGTGMQQLEALMKVAARSRSVASTKMNAQSSRSHSVFMLHLRGYNDESGAEVHGALNLCDLAGSERLDRSGANADAKRLRETQAINKSLSCLGDVFNALALKSSHVPYRNSKLTYLLQDCLSGDGKALMFVNLSPTNASSNESLCSLRFAQRVNQVELGKATKHIQYNH